MKKMMILCGAIVLVGFGYFLGVKKTSHQDDIFFSIQAASSVSMLSYTEKDLLETFDGSDQIDLFLTLHEELVSIHQLLMLKHQELKEVRQTLIDARNSFRTSNQRLSRENGTMLWHNYYDLLDLKNEFKQTQGLAYQRLLDLKGQYLRENIDLIIDTYADVIDVLFYREHLLNQACELINQSLFIYQHA